jgi:predicted ATPase/class 3 adenylate cyclase
MQPAAAPVTFVFTDIEGSTRLWETAPEAMRAALARHDAIGREAVAAHRGRVVKTTGDGMHAVFGDPLDAIMATLALQQALLDATSTAGVALHVRCGIHLGVDERRDDDFYGPAVNRAARIMAAAHGGQILASEAVALLVRARLSAEVTLKDLGEVRLRDLASAERIYQVQHPSLRASFPALRSLEATPNNLPQQVTSFIGRDREKVEVGDLLAKHRLVMLQGAGGIGKSRLSLQVAADLMDEFPDGVWLVELAALTDARLVPQAIASVLGVKEEAGYPVVDALVKAIADRRLLLILDNCEHLVEACAQIARQVLNAGPLVRILASSREPLHVAGEAIFPLQPLAVPDPYGSFKRQALEGYAAARLFIERASAAQPTFAVSDDNAMAVAGICQRLDGIPLALELAAARVRSLSVEQISARLSDRFRLLTGGDRTALPRQQTLRALIDWSFDLLTPQERVLFRRLAVFAGGFTLEGAEAVGAAGELLGAEVLPLLTNLVEKSLVTMDAGGERYRLLETVRHYALDRLASSGEVDATRSRHLVFYVGLAETARPALTGPRVAHWVGRLEAERENLLAAHVWCDSAEGGGELGLRLLDAVKFYLLNRGLLVLGHRLLIEALARSGAQARARPRARALFEAGQFCNSLGRYEEALGLLEESLSISNEIGDKWGAMQTLQPLGEAANGQGDIDAARRYLEEAVARSRESTDKRELASALVNLGQLYRLAGPADAALPLFVEGIALMREVGDHESVGLILLNLAMVSIGQGALDRVPAVLREVVDIAVESGSAPVGKSVLEVASALAAAHRDWPRTARYYGAAEAQATATGFRRDPTDEAFLAPYVDASRAALGAEAFSANESVGGATPYAEALADARSWLESLPG